MVEDSPAAVRNVRCGARKHSPWSAMREKKRGKALLASPECQEPLSEEIEEEEDEEPAADHGQRDGGS